MRTPHETTSQSREPSGRVSGCSSREVKRSMTSCSAWLTAREMREMNDAIGALMREHIDRFSDPMTPTRSNLCEIGGGAVRKLDTNPVYEREGYKFGKYEHTLLWRKLDGKNPSKGYGVWVANEWFWYDAWIAECKAYCQARDERQMRPV